MPSLKTKLTLFSVVLLFPIWIFAQLPEIGIIPRPNQISRSNGYNPITQQTKLVFLASDSSISKQLLIYLNQDADLKIQGNIVDELDGTLTDLIFLNRLSSEELENDEYELIINHNQIWINYSDELGAFYAMQSLRQLLILYRDKEVVRLPELSFRDRPMFDHRGLLLDCSRHFFSIETVKKYIDLLAFYKMNVLHWHLTEDQGWRIQIDKYPLLTEVGAWRTEQDGSRYGGYYTKDQIRDIVKYAEERFVTIIPEIEMPGHSQAAIAAYPELSCEGKSVDVANDWGVFKEIYCAGNDSTFMFIEDVLTEVMELFPSKYIHIGGDEAPKYRWENCTKCQKRISDEGLKDEHELQSYFITRIEEFLNANERELIGWDEILEGGLSPNASVQSWRGMDHGVVAARAGHKVIMSPTSHCYLDYDLSAINLEKVYSFNPIPKELEEEYRSNIIGGEVNMWSEHVPDSQTLDHKVFPRMIAMAEVLWSGSGGDFLKFYRRLQTHYPLLDGMGVKYGLEAEPIELSTFRKANKTFFELKGGVPDLILGYYYQSESFEIYRKAVPVKKTDRLDFVAIKANTQQYGELRKDSIFHHLGFYAEPTSKDEYSQYYTASGKYGLMDGLKGSLNFRDGRWQGYSGIDMNITLEWEEVQKFKEIKTSYYQYNNAWIFIPTEVECSISKNGKKWFSQKLVNRKIDPEERGKMRYTFKFRKLNGKKFKYVRIMAKNLGEVPEWHEAAGSEAWIFADEIIIY